MSKFTSAMNAAKNRSASVALQASQEPEPDSAPAAAPKPAAPGILPARRGRPAGKRSSANTVQVTAYIQTETHYATKLALLMNSRKGGARQDFSDLVQALLERWLATQKS